MILNPAQCYQSLLSHDSRFDGRFFVAVRTTRIYCRPICRVKPPLRRNCTFYAHAAEAEVAGYRPCKMCRPELAPGHSPMDFSSQLARSAAAHLNEDYLADHSLEDLAQKLGITDRQMRRVFRDEFGVSPIEYWQTQRLLLAKQLLTDSRLKVTSVALASGFQSLRRFNFALKERYRMTPTELRRRRRELPANDASEFSFRLGYRPPFDWEHLLAFLSRRAVPGVEKIEAGAYFRTVRIRRQTTEYSGFLEVRHDRKRGLLAVRLSDSLIPVCVAVLDRVRRLFDLGADPLAINQVLGSLAKAQPGLRVPGSFDSFEMAVRTILGQQISVSGARTLAGRFVSRFGDKASVVVSGLSLHFPSPGRIARAKPSQIASLGITARRAETILVLSKAIAEGQLVLEPGHRVEGTLRRLRQIPGVGEWTVQYLAMRTLSWPDAFPHTDLGVARALAERNPRKILEIAEKWRPWRAYAALHLWASLEQKS